MAIDFPYQVTERRVVYPGHNNPIGIRVETRAWLDERIINPVDLYKVETATLKLRHHNSNVVTLAHASNVLDGGIFDRSVGSGVFVMRLGLIGGIANGFYDARLYMLQTGRTEPVTILHETHRRLKLVLQFVGV